MCSWTLSGQAGLGPMVTTTGPGEKGRALSFSMLATTVSQPMSSLFKQPHLLLRRDPGSEEKWSRESWKEPERQRPRKKARHRAASRLQASGAQCSRLPCSPRLLRFLEYLWCWKSLPPLSPQALLVIPDRPWASTAVQFLAQNLACWNSCFPNK